MLLLVFAVLILLAGSAFCSSSEAAIFSVSKAKLESLINQDKKSVKKAFKVKNEINKSIGSVVILNNFFNIIGTIYAGILAAKFFANNELYLAIFSGILTFLVILLGEILPKNFGEKFALNYLLAISPIVIILNYIFTPILWILNIITEFLFKKNYDFEVSEEEIRVMLEKGKNERSIEQDEHKLINNVFSLNDKTAKDIMTPRVNVEFIDANLTLEEQKDLILETSHSRLPVFDGDYDNIIGFLLTRVALENLAKKKNYIKPVEIIHQIIKIKETTKVDSLLIMFQKKQAHMAIVVDEFGGTGGLVTLEDAIEEIVGEIVDETDEVVDMREVNEF